MARNKFSVIVYIIIGLAVIGIVTQIFTNPVAFARSIFIMIGVGVAIFAVIYFVFFRKQGSSNTGEMKKYKQAVKQSQVKYKQNNSKPRKAIQHNQIRKRSNRKVAHLTVIDGNKDKPKRKNRAQF